MSVKRFVSWAAVSSEEQVKTRHETKQEIYEEEKQSLQNQLRLNREHAAKHGGRIIVELVVDGESRDIVLLEDARQAVNGYMIADGEQRPCKPYAELHRLINDRAFDVLIFLNHGRLGRDSALSMAIVRLCHRAGIVTYGTQSPPATLERPTMSHRDYLVDAISAVGYQEEIAEIKRRNTLGMASRVERGDFAYRVPFPWIEKREGKKRWVEVDERGAEVIRLLVDLYINQGRSLDDIAAEMNLHGYRTPKGGKWYESRVKYMVDNIWRYAGDTWINKKSLTGRQFVRSKMRWPAIITDEEAQAVEDEQYRRFFGRGSVHTTHRFSQCVYCAVCGQRMGAQHKSDRKADKSYSYERYVCPGNHPGKYIQAWRVMEAIDDSIAIIERTGDLTALLSPLEDRTPLLQSKLSKLESQLESHRKRLDRVDDAYADGAMDLAGYRRQTERIKADIAVIQEEIDATRHLLLTEQRTGNRLERLQEIAASGRSMLEEADIPKANAFFRRLFRVTVADGRVARIETI